MTKKTPSDFTSHDDWLSYVSGEIALPEQSYALAFGRMELFRSFYRMQRLPFPIPIAQEFERIETLQDPERTAALEEVNDEMFRCLTGHLLDRAWPTLSEDYAQRDRKSTRLIQELLRHLAQKNPYFALWVVYKRSEEH